jgi:hypothetical protein
MQANKESLMPELKSFARYVDEDSGGLVNSPFQLIDTFKSLEQQMGDLETALQASKNECKEK